MNLNSIELFITVITFSISIFFLFCFQQEASWTVGTYLYIEPFHNVLVDKIIRNSLGELKFGYRMLHFIRVTYSDNYLIGVCSQYIFPETFL